MHKQFGGRIRSEAIPSLRVPFVLRREYEAERRTHTEPSGRHEILSLANAKNGKIMEAVTEQGDDEGQYRESVEQDDPDADGACKFHENAETYMFFGRVRSG
jgi:hypothetical protein